MDFIKDQGIGAANWLYLPSGWDAEWVVAKQMISQTPTWVTFIGDSITQGLIATDLYNTSYVGLMRKALYQKYSPYADFFASWYNPQSNISATYTGQTFTTMDTTGSPTLTASGYGRVYVWTGATTTNLALYTFVTPYACTSIDIIYIDRGTGTFKYAVDGGAKTTITNATANVQKRISLTGLTNTTHTVVISDQSATSAVTICGFVTYRNTSTSPGIGIANLGQSGISSRDWALNTGQPADMALLLQGKYASGAVGFGFPTQPHLAVVALSINDCQNLYGVDIYRQGLRRVIQALRRGQQNCSIILMPMYFADSVSSDTTFTFTNPESYQVYVEVMSELARVFNCAFVNIHGKWGEYAVANGYLNGSNAHPADSGHTDIANTLLAII